MNKYYLFVLTARLMKLKLSNWYVHPFVPPGRVGSSAALDYPVRTYNVIANANHRFLLLTVHRNERQNGMQSTPASTTVQYLFFIATSSKIHSNSKQVKFDYSTTTNDESIVLYCCCFLSMRRRRALNQLFLFDFRWRFCFVFFGRVPRGKECRPDNAGQQDNIQLVSNRNKLKIEQLNGNPKGPLGDLRVPENIRNAVVDLLRVHALHEGHGAVVETVGNPGPVDELFLSRTLHILDQVMCE